MVASVGIVHGVFTETLRITSIVQNVKRKRNDIRQHTKDDSRITEEGSGIAAHGKHAREKDRNAEIDHLAIRKRTSRMQETEKVNIYLDGKLVEWGVLEVKPKMLFSNGMQIVQNIYTLQGAEVLLDRIEQYIEVNEAKIFLRSK
jgi:hypothetical protein